MKRGEGSGRTPSVTLAGTLLLAAAAGGAAGDEETVEIPVGDLVSGAGLAIPPGSPRVRLFASGNGFSEGDGELLAGRKAALADDDLVRTLTALGEGEGGPMSVRAGRLIVPAAAADRIRSCLARIRSLRPRPIDLEYAIETSPDGKAWTAALAGREPVLPGERRVFSVAEDRAYLSDFDVEIATGAQIADPIMYVLRTGTRLSVTLLPFPAGTSALVDAEAAVAEPLAADPIQAHHPDWAPLDRGATNEDGVRTTYRIEAGRESLQEWTGRGGRRMRLRLTARWEPPAVDRHGRGVLAWSPLLNPPCPLVSRRRVGYRLLPAGSEQDERWNPFGMNQEMRLEAWERASGQWEGRRVTAEDPTPTGLVVWTGEEAAFGRESLIAALDEECRSRRATIVATEVAAGAAGAGGGREVFRASGPLLDDLGVVFESFDARTFLQDADVEVATGATTADPMLGLLQTGIFCNLRVKAGAEGAPASVDLDLQFSRLLAMDSVALPVVRPDTRAVPGEWKDEKGKAREGALLAPAPVGGERGQYALERPRVAELRVAGLIPLGPGGKAVLRRTVPGFLPEGKELLVEIEVQ